jgi:hypothetical protein
MVVKGVEFGSMSAPGIEGRELKDSIVADFLFRATAASVTWFPGSTDFK